LRDCRKADAAVVIQSDRLKATDSALVLPTSAPADTSLCRLQIEPSAEPPESAFTGDGR